MIPTQTFIDFPEFCNAGTKTKPDSAKYSSGFVEADVLPAEWLNYFENKSSAGITELNRGVSSIEKEMNNVLSSAGKTASESSSDQLVNSIKYLIAQAKAEAILASHPVGSLYWTESTENPNVTFGGGTWVQIKDKFILAAGDTYTNKATGGSATVTLTVTNLPSHSHTYTPSGSVSVASHTHGLNNHTHTFTPAGTVTVASHVHGLNSHTHTFTPAGTVSVASHSHGLNNHTHSFTPSGTVTVSAHSHGLNSHTHTFTHTHNISHTHTRGSMNIKGYFGDLDRWRNELENSTLLSALGISQNAFYINSTALNSDGKSGAASNTQTCVFDASRTWSGSTSDASNTSTSSQSTTTTGAASGNTANATPTGTFTGTADATGGNTSNTTSTAPSATFTGTPSTTGKASGNTAATTPSASFSGTTSSTGGNSGNTTATTPSATFTGSQGTTLTTGSGTSFSIMPPYEVKFCWKRTA